MSQNARTNSWKKPSHNSLYSRSTQNLVSWTVFGILQSPNKRNYPCTNNSLCTSSLLRLPCNTKHIILNLGYTLSILLFFTYKKMLFFYWRTMDNFFPTCSKNLGKKSKKSQAGAFIKLGERVLQSISREISFLWHCVLIRCIFSSRRPVVRLLLLSLLLLLIGQRLVNGWLEAADVLHGEALARGCPAAAVAGRVVAAAASAGAEVFVQGGEYLGVEDLEASDSVHHALQLLEKGGTYVLPLIIQFREIWKWFNHYAPIKSSAI